MTAEQLLALQRVAQAAEHYQLYRAEAHDVTAALDWLDVVWPGWRGDR